ncbi:MAG: hypothetical protein ACI9XO_001070 [Paraglaciecola sp.]|jgi:hypothetical protein
MKKLLFLAFTFLMFLNVQAQETVEELKAAKAEKSAAIAALQGELNAIETKIKTFPGWKFGFLGTAGFNISQFNSWLGAANANAKTTTIGLAANGAANLDRKKIFWRNSAGVVYTKTKLVADSDLPEDEQADFETTADALTVSSLYGYKLTEKFAISALGEFRSTISNFNNPGYLDLGVGGTWRPMADLVVVFHPLNYNFVFSDDDVAFQSSLGAKVLVDYSKALPIGIAWKSSLSAFLSYEDASNLSSWTWVNGFSMTVWKGLGVGFDLGLRQNKQEALGVVRKAQEIDGGTATADFDTDFDNPLQSYWLLGLTYAF